MKKTQLKKQSCVTASCTETIGDKSITGLCKRCYSSVYGWTKRSNADVIARVHKLHLFEDRMNLLIPKTKVKIIRPNTTFVSLVVLPGSVAAYCQRTKYKTVSNAKQPQKLLKQK